jgi:hypothetical protein
LSKSRGNFVMREMPEKRQVDRLSLLLGQVVQQRSHTRCLIIFV